MENQDDRVRAYLDDNFHIAWNHLIDHADPETFDSDLLKRWWDTLVEIDLNYEMLMANMIEFGMSPFISMLTVYLYGIAQGINGAVSEDIILRDKDTDRTPPWLEQIWLEDLKKRYEHKH